MESEGGQKSQGVAGRARAIAAVVLLSGEMASTTTSSQGEFPIYSSLQKSVARDFCWAEHSGAPFQALCGLFV